MDFLNKVKVRFGPSKCRDYQVELSKLMQKGIVAEFQSDFEHLMNRVTRVSKALLISFFVGGLKTSLKRELLMNKPHSLEEAFALAKEHEELLEELVIEAKANHKWSNCIAIPTIGAKPNFPTSNEHGKLNNNLYPRLPATNQTQGLLPTPNLPRTSTTSQTTTTQVPIRKMSNAEMQEKREKRLCFSYDHK
ncbi:hypothetical protein CRYUN_Cryun30bG0090800 [Craigia yunnanensis]